MPSCWVRSKTLNRVSLYTKGNEAIVIQRLFYCAFLLSVMEIFKSLDRAVKNLRECVSLLLVKKLI